MDCPTCLDTQVSAFCRECGKGVCDNCIESRDGIAYCRDCVPVEAEAPEEPAAPPRIAAPPPTPPRSTSGDETTSPFLAGFLGLVPGLGAVVNGQYAKGVVHVAIFALLVAISTSSEETAIHALMVPLIIFFVLYMPIEAVRTAQAIRRGEQVDEMSGIAGSLLKVRTDSPIPGIIFIALGVLFLLFTLGVLQIDFLVRMWPVLLIVFGIWRLYASIRARDEVPARPRPQIDPIDTPE